jgi:hypothetical protein
MSAISMHYWRLRWRSVIARRSRGCYEAKLSQVSPVERGPAGHRSHREHLDSGAFIAKIDPRFIPIDLSFCAQPVWHDLTAYNLAHQTFTGVAEFNGAIHKAVEDLNRERAVVPLAKPRTSA